ncbi:MAG: S8 family serine peptidase, partial [Bacteroidota bacterium]
FRLTHEDLTTNLHPDYYDLGNNDKDLTLPGSFGYHGCAVSGVAAATPNNGVGIAGVGFNCSYLPIKAVSDDGASFALEASLAYLASRGVAVINMSFGRREGAGGYSRYEEDLFNYYAINEDIVLVAAGGQKSASTEERWYPASYRNVISVGGSRQDDRKDSQSDYSYEINLLAPYRSIYTTYNRNDSDYYPASGISGTSFSAPQVAAAAALVRTQYPSLSALQVKARLEATADDVEALNSPTLAGKIGQGRLNVHQAIAATNVRYVTSIQQNYAGKSHLMAGDTATLVCNFQNWLGNTNNLEATLSSTSPFVTVTQANIALGAVSANGSTNNTNNPFVLIVDEDIPPGTEVYLRIDYRDGDALNFEYFSVLVSPQYYTIAKNQLAFTLRNNGQIATYYDCSYCEDITYQGNSLATSAGLLIANRAPDPNIASTVSWYFPGNPQFKSSDFTVTETFRTIQNTEDFEQATVTFTDTTSNPFAVGVFVKQQVYAWKEAPNDKFVVVRYDVTNITEEALEDFYVGLFVDWDIHDPTKNKASWDTINQLGYVYSIDQPYGGLKLLTEQNVNYFAIDHDNANGAGIQLTDIFDLNEQYGSLASGTTHTEAGITGEGNNVAHTLSAHIPLLPKGSTETIAFAILVDDDFTSLQQTALQAQETFLAYNTSEQPAIDNLLSVCPGEEAILAPTNGTQFKFYNNTGFTSPLASGASYQTERIDTAQKYYIVHEDETKLYPSAPFAVDIQIKTPAVGFTTSQDTLNLFTGNTLLLTDTTAQQASSIWRINDEEKQGKEVAYTFTETGNYTIQLSSTDQRGCNDTVTRSFVVVNRPPTRLFPNPANQQVTIETYFDHFDWQIKDALGVPLKSGESSAYQTVLPIQDLQAGIYFVEVQSQGERHLQKLMISR